MISEEQAEKLRKKLLEELEKLPAEQTAKLKEQIKTASPAELEAFVKQQAKVAKAGTGGTGECIFCQIIQGTIETIKAYEDDDVLAILDIAPAALGHVLVMPKQHVQFLFQLQDELLAKLSVVVKKLVPVIINVTKAAGLDIYAAQGANQKVPHIALNLIPRFPDDKLSFEWERKKVERKELEKIAQEISKRVEAEKERKEQEEKKVGEEIESMVKQMGKRIP